MDLPFDLSQGQALYMAAALVVAAIVRGITGFGFSAIVVAMSALITNPLPLIPVVFSCEIAMTLFQARGIWAHIDWRRTALLLGGTIVAIGPAVYVMARLDETQARVAISLIIMVFSGLLASGWQWRNPIGGRGHFAVGIVAGMANSAGVGGLPVGTFLAAQPIAPAVFRATMIAFLTGIDLLTLPVMAANGLISDDTLPAIAMAFPLLGLGIFIGTKLFGLVSADQFRKIVIYFLVALCALNISATL